MNIRSKKKTGKNYCLKVNLFSNCISPNPNPFAYVHYLQDWPEWVNRGIVDELVIQVYRSDQNRFMWELNKPSIEAAERKIPVAIGILSGLRAYEKHAMDTVTVDLNQRKLDFKPH